MLDRGQMGAQLHSMIKARQWAGAASLINGICCISRLCVIMFSVKLTSGLRTFVNSLPPIFLLADLACYDVSTRAAIEVPHRDYCRRRAIGAFQAVGAAATALGCSQERAVEHRRAVAGLVPGGVADERFVPAGISRFARQER
eukprot:SAG11_NODE_779_length_7207_cov_3.043894_4_plen_143_part_00